MKKLRPRELRELLGLVEGPETLGPPTGQAGAPKRGPQAGRRILGLRRSAGGGLAPAYRTGRFGERLVFWARAVARVGKRLLSLAGERSKVRVESSPSLLRRAQDNV